MKARKIDLTPYPLTHRPMNPEGKPYQYDVRGSLAELCFVPELQLTGRDVLSANRIAQTILDAGPSLLLAEMDYSRLSAACLQHKGFTRDDVELVRRVLEAPEVEVTEVAAPAPSPERP